MIWENPYAISKKQLHILHGTIKEVFGSQKHNPDLKVVGQNVAGFLEARFGLHRLSLLCNLT